MVEMHRRIMLLQLVYVLLITIAVHSEVTTNETTVEVLETTDEQTSTVIGNSTSDVPPEVVQNVSESTSSNTTLKFVNCLRGLDGSSVQLTNDTELIKLLLPDPKVAADKDAAGLCVLVLFYSKNCPFSSMAAPHFNALSRAFPDIKMVAINAMRYHLFNTQNGIVGVPTLLLFHNGRPIVRFNGSEYSLDTFIKFITRHTGIEAKEQSVVTSADFAGPVVSSPSKDTDMFLIFSWLFTILCASYYFTKSRWWNWIVEAIQSNWRESEAHAQHEHVD